MEADLVSAVVYAYSEREQVMSYIMTRVEQAWTEGEIEQAQSFNRLLAAFEKMSDDEWEAIYRVQADR